jgi:hypothetical protein
MVNKKGEKMYELYTVENSTGDEFFQKEGELMELISFVCKEVPATITHEGKSLWIDCIDNMTLVIRPKF